MTKTREAAEWYHVGLRSALKYLIHKQDEVSSKELLGSLHRNQSCNPFQQQEGMEEQRKGPRTGFWDIPLSFNKGGWEQGQGIGPDAAKKLADGFHSLETVTDLINEAKAVRSLKMGVENYTGWKLWISAILLRNVAWMRIRKLDSSWNGCEIRREGGILSKYLISGVSYVDENDSDKKKNNDSEETGN